MIAVGGVPPTAVIGAQTPHAAIINEVLALDLIPAEEVLTHGVRVVDASVSHRSFQILVGARPRLFVKCESPAQSLGRHLVTEVAVYRLAASSPELAGVVPRCLGVIHAGKVIVLEAVPGTPLSDTALAYGEMDSTDGLVSPRLILHGYGRAVARVHRVQAPQLGSPPWLLSALEPCWGGYSWLPWSCRELLLELAAQPSIRRSFGRAAARWRPSVLVHGDLRWANVLAETDTGNTGLWLVDWELACAGDPAWDVGCVIADLLGAAATRAVSESAPLPDLWEAAHAFLAGYRSVASPPPQEWRALLQRSVALAGIRLIQTLIEYDYADLLATMKPVLLPWSALLLSEPPALIAELAGYGRSGCNC